MRKGSIVAWMCMIMVSASLTAGCGQKADESSQKAAKAQEGGVSQSGEEKPAPAERPGEGAQIVRVTEIAENTITAEEGMFQRSAPPDGAEDKRKDPPGENGAPDWDSVPGENYAPGEGKGDNNENSMERGGGERQFDDGERPEGRDFGGDFESSGETVTFQVMDSTEILLGSPQGNQQGTIEDISVGSTLVIVLDAQNQAEQIIISNRSAGDGMPPETMQETEL
ncbi:MAG: hypothetical protein HFJ05_09695 [Eubacterium sp.]|nr:hypothetical protein [Eubacterium sp.]